MRAGEGTSDADDRARQLVRLPESRDRAALWDLLHPDVVFESPVVHTPQRGRDITFKYLASADAVLGGPRFKYVGEWLSERGAVLEFETEIDGITINGVDIIKFSDDVELITHFKVMVRPLQAVNLLHRLMGEQLARQPVKPAAKSDLSRLAAGDDLRTADRNS